MNNEDKIRFARYRKGYISTKDDEELFNKKKIVKENQTQVLGYVSNIDIKNESLINQITQKSKYN